MQFTFVLEKKGLEACFNLKATWAWVENRCSCEVLGVKCTRSCHPGRGCRCAATRQARDLVIEWSHCPKCHPRWRMVVVVVFTLEAHHQLPEDMEGNQSQIPPSWAFVNKDSSFPIKPLKSISIPRINPFSLQMHCVMFCVVTHNVGYCLSCHLKLKEWPAAETQCDSQ